MQAPHSEIATKSAFTDQLQYPAVLLTVLNWVAKDLKLASDRSLVLTLALPAIDLGPVLIF